MLFKSEGIFLHVGCGFSRQQDTTAAFNQPGWRELRFDINPSAEPDIVGTMTDMSMVAVGSMDAIFSSHNLEHLYAHEVPKAVGEFLRVLKPGGFAVLTCPDLQSVCALVAQDMLLEPAYQSARGPIAPLDILYGYRPDMARGDLFMAHRSGFTRRVLLQLFRECGFAKVICMQRSHPFYDLWLVAVKGGLPADVVTADVMHRLAEAHFPAEQRGVVLSDL